MKKRFCVLVCLLLIITTVGCSFSFSSAKVTDIVSCRDVDSEGKPIGITEVFHTDDTVMYISALTANVPSDTTISIVWRYTDGEETIDVDTAVIKLDEARYIYSNLTVDSGFPVGTYTAEVYVNDREEPDQVATITVK